MELYEDKNIRLFAGQQQIRLLRLLPGKLEDEIKCQIFTAQFSDKPSYECISYSWGTAQPEISISCNGVDFLVRQSLYSALRGLRHETETRILWTDAICINQSDSTEKSHQVSLMKSIYQQAKCVLVWLGDETSDSKLAMETVGKLSAATPRPGVGVFSNRQMQELGIPSTFSFAYPAVLAMLKEAYFTRSWVVQEIGVSKDAEVYWGRYTVKWTDLVKGLDVARELKLPFSFHPSLIGVSAIEDARDRFSKHTNRSLLDLLRQHRGCMATDPRDKVFAFWGLLDDDAELKSKMRPDYSLGTADVYVKAATAILEDSQSLDLLSIAVESDCSNGRELPSWVPDWEYPYEGPSLISEMKKDIINPYRCAGDTLSSACVLDGESLLLSGYCFDTLAEVGGTFLPYPLPQKWRIGGLDTETEYVHTKQKMVDAYWQTLATGMIRPGDDISSIRNDFEQWRKLSRLPTWLDKPYLGFLRVLHAVYLIFLSIFILQKPASNFQTRTQNVMGRQLVRTEEGYIGLASGLVERGDKVTILRGSRVPMVVRAHGDAWKLQGDAYIHGIMGGEAFKEEKCGPVLLV